MGQNKVEYKKPASKVALRYVKSSGCGVKVHHHYFVTPNFVGVEFAVILTYLLTVTSLDYETEGLEAKIKHNNLFGPIPII